jgi:PilZ domain
MPEHSISHGTADQKAAADRHSNKRQHPRVPAEALPDLTAQLGTDSDVRLIDVSRGGALFECQTRLLPGSPVAMRLVTHQGAHVVRGRVLRSRMVRLENGRLGYEAAVAFSETQHGLIDEPLEEAMAGPQLDTDAAESGPSPDSSSIEEDLAEFITLTAVVHQSSDDLRELFNGNDW